MSDVIVTSVVTVTPSVDISPVGGVTTVYRTTTTTPPPKKSTSQNSTTEQTGSFSPQPTISYTDTYSTLISSNGYSAAPTDPSSTFIATSSHSSSSIPTPSAVSAHTAKSHNKHIGAIVGGSIGGIVIIIASVLGIYVFRKIRVGHHPAISENILPELQGGNGTELFEMSAGDRANRHEMDGKMIGDPVEMLGADRAGKGGGLGICELPG